MFNRQARTYAHQLSRELEGDPRYSGLTVTTGSFKGREHVEIDGKVQSQAVLDALIESTNETNHRVWIGVDVASLSETAD